MDLMPLCDNSKEVSLMNDIIRAIQDRSSTRGYTPDPLTDAELDTLLSAGLQAPTAANRQEIHFSVVQHPNPILQEIEDEKNTLAGVQNPPANFYYDAPVVLFLSGDRSFPWSAVDAGIACENIALAAEGLGLGSVIIGCVRNALTGAKESYFAEALKFPEGYEFQVAIAVGRKALTKEPHTYDAARNISRI